MRDDELLHRFLLGELTEDEAERVEERLLEEDELFDLCEAIEADLLEAAVRGGLAPAERERVLSRLASSQQGRARLALARNLVDIAAPRRALLFFPRLAALTARPAVRWAAAACLVALLGGTGTWTWFHNRPEVQSVDEDRPITIVEITPPQSVDTPVIEPTEPEPTPPPPSPDENAVIPPPEPPPRVETGGPKTFVVQLAALLRAGEEQPIQKTIRVPDGMEHVAFHADFTGESFASYGAIVKRDGEEILNKDDLELTPIEGVPMLVLTLPARDVLPGRYKVEIFGNPAKGDPEPLTEQKFEVTGGG